MGKRKQVHSNIVEDYESPEEQTPPSHKKHKKHKKKHKRKAVEENEELESPKASLKLKFKIGGETLGTKNVVSVTAESTDDIVNVTDDQPWGEVGPDVEDPDVKTKKSGDDTTDEEKEWLTALEKGELDDYGEVSKGKKDPSLMTARQRALKHGTQEQELLQLPTGYRQVEMTEEQLKRREQRANKRKQIAHEKREKDKKQTIDRLLKKQEKQLKGSAKARAGKKTDAPKVTYLNSTRGVSISVPEAIKFPMESRNADKPLVRPRCGVKGCKNDRKYSCSKTGVSLCSLQCYKKNLSLHKLTLPGLVTT